MNSNLRNRLLIAAVLATGTPLVLGSTAALAQGNPHQQKSEKDKRAEARAKAETDRQAAAQSRQDARQHQEAAVQHERQAAMARDAGERQRHADAAQAQRQAQAAAEQRATARRAAANQAETKAARDQARADRQKAQVANQAARQEDRADRQQAQVANQAARQQARSDRQTARLAKVEQDRLIAQQKARVSSYRNWVSTQRAQSQRIAAAVQAQNRAAQYAYITDYNNRLYAQQQRYASSNFDYYNDPYFYSVPTYRYMREGAWYTVNQYGVDLLQTAINDGYNEGYRAGKADRMDGWRADYRSNWVYQNASYGYNGYYLDRGDYTYYFREGFRRGYEDGYYSRYQYGHYTNGSYSIVGAVLNTILGLQPYSYRY